MSPYMAKIVGQEDFVYVWTLGVAGRRRRAGQARHRRREARLGELRQGRQHALGRRPQRSASLRAHRRPRATSGPPGSTPARSSSSTSTPIRRKPTLHKTIDDFVAKSGGVVGPHTLYALPGRMLITGLSNNKDHGGRTGMVEYTNDGKYVDHALDADRRRARRRQEERQVRRRLRLRRARAAAPQRASSPRRSPAGTTT